MTISELEKRIKAGELFTEEMQACVDSFINELNEPEPVDTLTQAEMDALGSRYDDSWHPGNGW